MGNPHPKLENLKPFKPGQSGNPAGAAKGSKHISTWIQELLADEGFEANLIDSKKGYVEYKGAPIKAIILTARHKAVNGDDKAREWLAKYGWGTKTEIQHSGAVATGAADPALAAEFADFLKGKTKE